MSKNIFVFLMCFAGNSSLAAANGVCFHCEEIREYNRLHPQNYEYYEEYLEEQQKKAAEIQPDGVQIKAHPPTEILQINS